MMKKLLLLLASGGLSISAMAQLSNNSSVVLTKQSAVKEQKTIGDVPQLNRPVSTTANKGTGQTKRTYNWIDYLILGDPTIETNANLQNSPYMWHKSDMYGIYQGTTALERDTIVLNSIGSILYPWWRNFNNNVLYPGSMAVSSADAYVLDSVYVGGFYGRNPAKPSVVDTMRFTFVYGNGGTSNIITGSYGFDPNYNDTVVSGLLTWDAAKYTAGRPQGSTGPTVLTKDVLLKVGDSSSTRIGVSAGLSVPAGNLVGVSVTFKTGENYTPFSDTAFRGSLTPAVPFKYGLFRPLIINEKETAFPSYYGPLSGGPTNPPQYNYNSGQFRQTPMTGDEFGPTWAWSRDNGTSPSDYQFPNIDFVISCPTCRSVGVSNVPSSVTVGQAFPNPSKNTVTLPITMKESAVVNVTLSNLVGQTMATQSFGTVSAGLSKNVTFNTAELANGVYFMTIEANSARTTTRFVVAH